MQLYENQDKDQEKTFSLPRVNQEFIGLGHQLQSYRKQKRQIQNQHQSIQNRVLLLEKQQQKARRQLLKKKKHFQLLISIRQRQQQENQEKAKLRQEKMQELQRLKKQTQEARITHKNNYQNTVNLLREKNQSDYSRIRQSRVEGQYRKSAQKDHDLRQKKDNWISVNISKQKGKLRIDSFYKRKNRQHVKQYQSRIQMINQEKQHKIGSIKQLQLREQSLRTKLQTSHQKNSKMEELIKNISRTLSPMNTRSIDAELYGTSRAKIQYSTVEDGQQRQRHYKTNSGIQNKFFRSQSNSKKNQGPYGEYIEQNIEIKDEDIQKNLQLRLQKRRRNKHINRYKQYEAY